MDPQPIVVNTTHIRHNTFGYYPLCGNCLVTELNNSKQESFIDALKLVKAANKDAKALILIWDNFASHKADKVIKAAEKEDIYLLFLPAYAPDLNPIEFIWKEVKRSIGEEIFIPDKP